MKLTRKNILGAWSLISFKLQKPDEPSPSRWCGCASHGVLIYLDSGCVSVSINSQYLLDGTVPKSKEQDHMLFYAGKFEFNAESMEIKHFVELASSPTRIGRVEHRNVVYDNGLLQLCATGSFGKALLEWKKINN